MERDLFKILQPVPGAPKALRALSDKDIRIRIITHRLYIKYTHKVSIQQTVEWLDRYGIPYWDICFMKDKAAVGADLYIEDSPDNVRALLAENLDVVVFTNPTNKDIKPPLRADRANTWSEAEKLVLGRLDKWKQAHETK